MEVEVPYGSGNRRVTVPDDARVVRSRALAPLQDARAAFDAALRALIEATPLAELPNVAGKLSGLVTEADGQRWQPANLAPRLTHALAVVGPRRVLFGRDWPVVARLRV